MSLLKFHKVNTLPGTLEADCFYFVINGNYAETYITNNAAVAKQVGNSIMINALIAPAIADALGAANFRIVADIAARNAIVTAGKSFLVLVTNATGDSTVASGAALYAFNSDSSTYIKVAEYESMDVILTWAAIQNKPTQPIADIDNAATFIKNISKTAAEVNTTVDKAHEHANKASLDQIGEDTNQNLTYRGSAISTVWDETAW